VTFAVVMLIVASGTDCPECTDFDWFVTWLIVMFFLCLPYLAAALAAASLIGIVRAFFWMSFRPGPSEREAGGKDTPDGFS
jgi:hypothetical protein